MSDIQIRGEPTADPQVCRFIVDRTVDIPMGAAGSMVVTRERRVSVPAAPVERVVDLTGAGDLYAAGFLFGLSRGEPYGECARLGSLAAAEVISHVGARPATSLRQLAGQAGLAA